MLRRQFSNCRPWRFALTLSCLNSTNRSRYAATPYVKNVVVVKPSLAQWGIHQLSKSCLCMVPLDRRASTLLICSCGSGTSWQLLGRVGDLATRRRRHARTVTRGRGYCSATEVCGWLAVLGGNIRLSLRLAGPWPAGRSRGWRGERSMRGRTGEVLEAAPT